MTFNKENAQLFRLNISIGLVDVSVNTMTGSDGSGKYLSSVSKKLKNLFAFHLKCCCAT